jgi:hypothetical protein
MSNPRTEPFVRGFFLFGGHLSEPITKQRKKRARKVPAPVLLTSDEVVKAAPAGAMNELGVSGLSRWGGYVEDEEFVRELRGDRGRKTLTEMSKNDPVIAAMLRSIGWICRSVEFPVTGDNPDQVELVESCMKDMSHSWADFVSEILTMLVYGWAFFEVVYKWRKGPDGKPESLYNDGAIGWRKIALRGQNTLDSWDFDDEGGLRGMKQTRENGLPVAIPMTKALLFRTSVERGNPEGESLLRPAYRPWYMVKNIQEIEGIGIERDLAGLPIIYLGKGTTRTGTNSDLAAAKDIVRNLRRDEQEGVVLPGPKMTRDGEGWLLELLGTVGRRSFDTGAVISRYEKRMALSVLAQWLMLGMDQVGSYALSKDQSDFFRQALEAILKIIVGTINRYAIPRLFDLNPTLRGEGALPEIGYSLPDRPDFGKYAIAVNTLVQAQVLSPNDTTLRDSVRDVMGLRGDEQIDETLLPVEAPTLPVEAPLTDVSGIPIEPVPVESTGLPLPDESVRMTQKEWNDAAAILKKAAAMRKKKARSAGAD